jgi:6-phosphogluconolactonase
MARLFFALLALALACSTPGGPDAPPPAGGSGATSGGRAGTAGPQSGGTGGGGMAVMPDGAGPGGGGGAGGSGGPGGADGGGAPAIRDAGPAADLASPDSTPASGTNPFVYVGSSGTSEIRIFQLDLDTGALLPRGTAPAGSNPNYLAFHPGKPWLYALNEVTPGRVVAFAINPATGALTMLNSQSSGGNGPAHISVHRSGRWLLSANYGSGHAAALPITDDGRLGPPVAPVLAGAAAHMIVDDGISGRFVFVPSKGTNRVLQYRFDDTSGRLAPNDPPFVAQGGAPRHMVFHRSGRWAFLLTEAGRSVISYRYDMATGLLSGGLAFAVPNNSGQADGAHILIHPSRELLYASIRFDDRLVIFDIDGEGRVQSPRFVTTQIARPWDFAIDATGRYLLVANNDTATIKVFRIDPNSGALTLVGAGATVAGRPRFVGLYAPP